LYHGFISPIAGKLSQLRLALLVSLIAYTFQDPSRAVDFLSKILESRERLGPEASLCIESDIIVMKLRLGLVDECRTLIDEAKDKLQLANTSEAIVFSKYYKAVSEFRKLAGPPEEFYKVSLTYLSYTPLESLSSSEQYELASDMSLAALTGEGVYNFGEVLATPLLATLDGTENQYLFDLIKAMNTGDIDSYNSLVNLHSERYFNQPVLKTFHEKIQQKVVLLCLMDMIFKRSSHDRTIAYQDISDKTRLPLEQVASSLFSLSFFPLCLL
jgi:26S proteasome regulatory subunit N9